MQYEFPVMEEKIKPHQVTTLHLVCALSFIGTGAIIFVYNYTITYWGLLLLATGLALAIFTIVRNKLAVQPPVNQRLRIGELLISLCMCAYSAVQQWKFPIGMYGVLSAALLFALYWERPIDSAIKVQVDNDGIKLPATSRKRFISWPEVELVVFRFGTLSVNCADNRLYQWNVRNADMDNEIFEAYCSSQVEQNKHKRRTDDW